MANKDGLVPLTIRIKPETKDEIEKRAQGHNVSMGEYFRMLIDDALSQTTLDGNKQLMREVFRDEIARYMNPVTDRIIKMVVKTFMQSATANALNQEVLAQLFLDESLSEEENLRYIKELADQAGVNAIKILKGSTDVKNGEK